MSSKVNTPSDELYRYYISLLKSALTGENPPEIPADLNLRQLYTVSAANHTTHMLIQPLSRVSKKPEPEINNLFMQQYAKSINRDAEQVKAYNEIVNLLTKNGISLLPVKGVELKKLYPESYMRRMTDIDIIYDSHGDDNKVRRLICSIGYSCESWGEGHHDIFHRLPLINLEMHRRADYPEYSNAYKNHIPDKNIPNLLHLTPADFYISLLKHNARHMKNGGLGVRAICDIFILKKHYSDDIETDYVISQLKENGIFKFSQKLCEIVGEWFYLPIPIISCAGQIILNGYTYGNTTDSEMLRLSNKNNSSKLRYAFSRIFPAVPVMKKRYGVLESCPCLLPVFWIIRGVEVLQNKKSRNNINTMKKVLLSDSENLRKYKYMLDEFGLDNNET